MFLGAYVIKRDIKELSGLMVMSYFLMGTCVTQNCTINILASHYTTSISKIASMSSHFNCPEAKSTPTLIKILLPRPTQSKFMLNHFQLDFCHAHYFFLPLFCPPSWFGKVKICFSSSVSFLDYWHLLLISQSQKTDHFSHFPNIQSIPNITS